MAWVVGIDEAGYGPNLGPFVMTAVACRLPNAHVGANLWQLLRAAVRKEDGSDDDRLAVDDSKLVYSTARGLGALERSVHAVFELGTVSLQNLLSRLCPDCLDELQREFWYRGHTALPCENGAEELLTVTQRLAAACEEVGAVGWQVRSVVMCAERFNTVTLAADSKGAVLADALGRLLQWNVEALSGRDRIRAFIDKHGGRNTYAAQLQHGLPGSMVLAREEGMARSVYEVKGLRRGLMLTFQPRAEAEHFCVALASMVSKYVREVLMREFNGFWAEQVPGLKPTAGYPGDSTRFFTEIRPTLERMQMSEHVVWRQR